ncbi:MAG TPA: hypothetical protein VFO10_06000 [Oligoflexus sp.]|uniref:hypothetical protein n=1 Tax=Oligoflexus sp. TaxID=1971216 RepID=UPI002D8026FF|nr:hypothetical protein [Oligoflexus sp.]HET9236781.1 hypothetical protein [Oligoflexus sp.]
MDELTKNDPGTKPKKRRQPRVERDIFGNEYLGAKTVFTLNLAVDQLPDGAQRLISLASSLQMTGYDLALVFSEALLMVDTAFWERKMEDLTPFEWTLHEALKDEAFRKVVAAYLDERR